MLLLSTTIVGMMWKQLNTKNCLAKFEINGVANLKRGGEKKWSEQRPELPIYQKSHWYLNK